MFNSIKEFPLRTFVKVQSAAVAAKSSPSQGSSRVVALLPSNREQRFGLVLGATIASVAYSVSVPALAALEGLNSIVQQFTGFAMLLVGILSTLMFVAAALMFVTSAGNQKMVNKAKDTIKWVVVGILLLGAMWALREILGTLADPGGSGSQVDELIQNKSKDAADKSATQGTKLN